MAAPLERIEFSRPAALPGVEVLLAEHSARRWRWFHETYTLCTVLDGRGHTEWAYRGKVHKATPGEVLLYEPGEVHQNRNVLRDAAFRVLFIPPGFVAEAAAELGLRAEPHWKVLHTAAASLRAALLGLHQAMETQAEQLEVQARFAACVRRVLELCAESAPPLPRQLPETRLQRARDYIHANYRRAVPLAELSRACGLSRFHLARAFSARFGAPPHAYQNALRVARARELVAAGARPAHLAADLGFADQSHFNRHFRRAAALTPTAYARMVRGVRAPSPISSPIFSSSSRARRR